MRVKPMPMTGRPEEGNSVKDRLRELLARHVFHTFQGMAFGDWWQLLRRHRFAIDLPHWPRTLIQTALSLANSANARREERSFGRRIDATEVHPPIFILGHWRSGTTHLHNLLALDPRFAFANTYQVVNPATFLTTEEVLSRRYAWMVPPKRLMDNMALSFQSPQEEEFAPALLSLRSMYLGMSFPRRMSHYERYLTFDDAPPEDRQAWQRAHLTFAQKLSF